MIKEFKIFEAVKWYHKGKFEKDDSVNIPEFRIGQKVSENGNAVFYWNDHIDKGDIELVGKGVGCWQEIRIPIKDEEIMDVNYCETKDYTGTLIKISKYYPWFQITNFEVSE